LCSSFEPTDIHAEPILKRPWRATTTVQFCDVAPVYSGILYTALAAVSNAFAKVLSYEMPLFAGFGRNM
jgi:hypothetical protein